MKTVALMLVAGLSGWLVVSLGPTTFGLLVAFMAATYLGLDLLRFLSQKAYRTERERRDAEVLHG